MPYIAKDYRPGLYPTSRDDADTPGELNYQITSIIQQYLARVPLSYTLINDVIGSLESAKLEFYRRVVVPYEDQKIADNGDVY